MKESAMEHNNNSGGNRHGNWPQHEEYVLHEIRAIRNDFKEHVVQDQLNFKEMTTAITELKTKIATWGAIIAGAATVAQPLLMKAAEVFLHR